MRGAEQGRATTPDATRPWTWGLQGIRGHRALGVSHIGENASHDAGPSPKAVNTAPSHALLQRMKDFSIASIVDSEL